MDKGKGKAQDSNNDRTAGKSGRAVNDMDGSDTQDRDGQQRGLLGSIAQSAQQYVTPDALSSVLASGGKGAAAGPGSIYRGGHSTSAAAVQDARSGSSFADPGRETRIGSSFRSSENQGAPARDDDYQSFTGPGVNGQTWSMEDTRQALQDVETEEAARLPPDVIHQLSIGAYSSTSQLEPHLYTQVREAHRATNSNHFGIAWDEAQAATDPAAHSLVDPSYHDAWAQRIPAASFDHHGRLRGAEAARGESFDALQQSVGEEQSVADKGQNFAEGDFMSALEQEKEDEELQHAAVPSGLSAHWRPPTPSLPGDMTVEQYNMHRALAEEQDHGKYAAEERIRPPDDDSVARTGVYAATPEEALQAIWGGQQEGERASVLERDQNAKYGEAAAQANVVQRIRRILQRGSYVDDVYGLPPALVATIETASQPETSDNRAVRDKALARLEALYRHLDATPAAAQPDEAKSFVRDW